ncbi:MAG: type II toxin-antitoxin system RelE/ParE family toxin [Treponema sp.]|nr:type II toxin-antitoxin system RelE/ParE family toxin [Treponema sp.]
MQHKTFPKAIEDLQEIKSYIENDLQNPIAAKNTINKIISTYEDLSIFPESGIPVQKYVPFATDYRFVFANNYSIFYRISNENILIIRILYSKRDFLNILFS